MYNAKQARRQEHSAGSRPEVDLSQEGLLLLRWEAFSSSVYFLPTMAYTMQSRATVTKSQCDKKPKERQLALPGSRPEVDLS